MKRATPSKTHPNAAHPLPPPSDTRPWDQWFAAFVDLARPSMTAEQALEQAKLDGLTLERSDVRRTSERPTNSCGFYGVTCHGSHYQAHTRRTADAHFAHITDAKTAEEAALHVARFLAYPPGVAAAHSRVIEARRLRDEQMAEQRAIAAAEADAARRRRAEEAASKRAAAAASKKHAEVERERRSEAERERKKLLAEEASAASKARAEARAEARREARRQVEQARALAGLRRRPSKEERARALEQAKLWQARRQAQLAAMQREQLRQAAQRQAQRQPAAARPCGGTAGAPHPAAPSAAILEQYETADLVRHVLAAQYDPWACLGLTHDAPPEAIRKRYLHLALRLHPDKALASGAKEAFTAMEAAFRACSRDADPPVL